MQLDGVDLAPGGDEIARVDDFDMPEHHMMLGHVKNRQPVLFHRHPGQGWTYGVMGETQITASRAMLC